MQGYTTFNERAANSDAFNVLIAVNSKKIVIIVRKHFPVGCLTPQNVLQRPERTTFTNSVVFSLNITSNFCQPVFLILCFHLD